MSASEHDCGGGEVVGGDARGGVSQDGGDDVVDEFVRAAVAVDEVEEACEAEGFAALRRLLDDAVAVDNLSLIHI